MLKPAAIDTASASIARPVESPTRVSQFKPMYSTQLHRSETAHGYGAPPIDVRWFSVLDAPSGVSRIFASEASSVTGSLQL